MRICFISHQSHLEGAERSLLELIRSLKERGVWSGVVVLKSPGPFMQELDRMEVPWKSIPCPWWTRSHGREEYPSGPIYQQILDVAGEVSDLVRRWEADILYSNTSVIGAGAMAAVLSNKPHVWHIREAAGQPESYEYLMKSSDLESFVNATSSHVIFNSGAVKAAWTNGRLPEKRTSVVYNSISIPQKVAEAPRGTEVDVVIPMHNDPFILKCLQSLLSNWSVSMGTVYILDDMSSDQTLTEAVRQKANQSGGRIVYRRNRTHLGFTGTCNEGMQLSDNDVILLNSDTLVTKEWVEGLKNSAHHKPDIGTVTPMSNNASLVSLPELYANNEDKDPERTAILLNKLAPLDHTDIPTSHGFCVYIKRSTIQKAGLFDQEAFGHGYGEENDYSMRLLQLGLRNVACCRTYVYHKGAQSFGQKKREQQIVKNMKIVHDRYPQYSQLLKDFRKDDPFHDLREPLRILKRYPELDSTFKFALAGTVTRWKRQLDAVKAVELLAREGKQVSLWIFGPVKDNVYMEEINRYISDHKLSEKVHYIGNLKNIAGMLSFCDATVVCSAFEPFGRVTLESMLSGRPVIGADGGGTSEIVDNEETGYLYTPGDPGELAQLAGKLVDSPEVTARMGQNARTHAERLIHEADYENSIFNILKESVSVPVPSEGFGFILESMLTDRTGHRSKPGMAGKVLNRFKKLLSVS